MLRRREKNGQSFLEYMALIMFILAAFVVFQKYLGRGFAGRWKATGEALGQGRIYDPRKTTECIYDAQHTHVWYDQACFESKPCDCLTVRANVETCDNCILGCETEPCKDSPPAP